LSEPNLQALHALCSERDRVLGNIVEYYTAWSARRRYGELTRRQSRMHERVSSSGGKGLEGRLGVATIEPNLTFPY